MSFCGIMSDTNCAATQFDFWLLLIVPLHMTAFVVPLQRGHSGVGSMTYRYMCRSGGQRDVPSYVCAYGCRCGGRRDPAGADGEAYPLGRRWLGGGSISC